MAYHRYDSSSRGGGRRRSAGVTLVELITALAVLAILVALAVPNFNDASLSARLNGFANSLVASAQVARSEAIKRNSTITLCSSSDGDTCDGADWDDGWIVLNPTTNDVLQVHQALPDEFTVAEAGGADQLSFLGTVVGTDTAALTVCRSAPVGSEERVVTISGTGSAYVTLTNAGSCP
jgi:type IV fimbrial biogenesis protein FimT